MPTPLDPTKAQINLRLRDRRHAPPCVEAVVWPYAPVHPGRYAIDASDQPWGGPGTMRIAVPPPSDDLGADSHFLHVLGIDAGGLYEFPVPADIFTRFAQARRDHVIQWLYERVARTSVNHR